MKTKLATHLLRSACLLFPILAVFCITGCCDGMILVGGTVLDATTGEPIDSARVSLYEIVKRNAEPAFFEYSDTLGSFLMEDFGYCGKEHWFITITKPGYLSQSLDVEASGPDLEIRLFPD
jgi:hypothetical protein